MNKLSIIIAHFLTLVAIALTLMQSRENARMLKSNREYLEAMSPKVAEMWHMKQIGKTNKEALNESRKGPILTP